MDTFSKMDGSAPVSPVLDGVWNIQKRGIIKDQKDGKGKKDQEKKEEETQFEDGLVSKEDETNVKSQTETEQDSSESENQGPSTHRKVDIII
jgi:hypothetical protein